MKVEVHILAYNEEEIMPYTLRHYSTFASKIVVHDAFSTDRTAEIARSFAAEVKGWDTRNQINDKLAILLKNNCWKGTDADWVITVDADELIYFPLGAPRTLAQYGLAYVSVVKPQGFEMYSEKFPTTTGQIYDEVKFGMRSDRWYGKPVLFTPKLVEEINLTVGAHTCRARLKNGGINMAGRLTQPYTYLLHCKHLGPIERLEKEYVRDLSRLSQINRERNWGIQSDPIGTARERRKTVMENLVRVIP